jgi:hypothetical protein
LASSGPGVVFEDVQGIGSHSAGGAPAKIVEVHEQVRRDAVDCWIKILRPVRNRSERVTPVVAESLERRLELLAHALVVGRRNDALRLAARNIDEESAVVTAFPPRSRALQSTRSALKAVGSAGSRLSVR